ncbi:hypothetical protein IE81DRAFT_367332 [Ceraceosorus guamensis]|uniref:Uncharacterized protein n=1 Tax=Ceraceosorus guamensis TaxID=1522189 RepID=A0A316VXJ9_9BASI|nr:hypothetical protein IE81DRAFT_367332 [Ceraceosorus guamensis]PWN41618.1 hypothetical protein IE81DRAFT_367332 [Ceraceosorus guamensis]
MEPLTTDELDREIAKMEQGVKRCPFSIFTWKPQSYDEKQRYLAHLRWRVPEQHLRPAESEPQPQPRPPEQESSVPPRDTQLTTIISGNKSSAQAIDDKWGVIFNRPCLKTESASASGRVAGSSEAPKSENGGPSSVVALTPGKAATRGNVASTAKRTANLLKSSSAPAQDSGSPSTGGKQKV